MQNKTKKTPKSHLGKVIWQSSLGEYLGRQKEFVNALSDWKLHSARGRYFLKRA